MLPPLPTDPVLAARRWPARLALTAAVAAGALAAAPPGHALAKAKPKPKPAVGVEVKHRTLLVRGTGGDDRIALRLRAGRPGVLEIDAGDDGSADARVRRNRFDRIVVSARGGADTVRIDESNGVFTDTEATTLDGGDGPDALLGGSGAERFAGGDGADLVDGGRGADLADLGAGDDTFRWDPGEGSDVVEGADGSDAMQFNGANVDERFDVSANGARVRFTRDIGTIVMDLGGVERIDTAALGGADTFTAHDLTGTGVTELTADLAGTPGGGAGDGAADRVVVEGTDGADAIQAAGQAGALSVAGAPALVRVAHADSTDRLDVDARAGDDAVSAATLSADAARLTIDGGAGDDRIDGGRGADVLIGGDGADAVDGGTGADVASLGAGDDAFRWDPGEGSDVVEGQAGHDVMQFNGANLAERFDVSANGSRVRFTRDIGSITMDLDGVEQIDTAALGGADTLTQHDTSGTDLTADDVDLAAALGGAAGDGARDRVVVEGTNGDDIATVAGDATGVTVSGLAAAVRITHADATEDGLAVNGLAGDDVVGADGLAAGALAYAADGGEGDDVLIGSAGADVLSGGPGDDVLLGGPGLDTLDGGPGANTVVQD